MLGSADHNQIKEDTMKNLTTRALACATALVAASSAYAAPLPSKGHYEWRTSMQQRPGPRASLLAPERAWVATPAMMSRTSNSTRMMTSDECADVASCMSHCAS